ncbi:AraC family transcriptional regulator [Paucibacter sp. APW11]|uniref:AraC family transcriptional regulator n=1 Tax=Roseateles aquae TaxID=3077235 RepID=A0ABU3PFJ0_9BURK|nr:AraC family transcriptional regulator [Paucibacter sp. APW11]MDT9001367.1 AraC family transcriptional regulator [Paucibacter sp. APW11]
MNQKGHARPLLKLAPLQHGPNSGEAAHAHAQGQLVLVQAGALSVETAAGRWLMPSGCLGWVPPGQHHGAVYHAQTQGMNYYFDTAWSTQHLPGEIRLVRLSPLLQALLAAINKANTWPDEALRPYLQVLAHAFSAQPEESLYLPMPRDPRLLKLTSALLAQPDDVAGLDAWAARIGMSRRTLMRRFQQETGSTVGHWQQQMRLLLALQWLSAGQSVTSVALEAGYQSVSAFIAVFKRHMGLSPGAWQQQDASP